MREGFHSKTWTAPPDPNGVPPVRGSQLQPSPFTLHHSPFTLHPSPFTLHPSPFTLNPTPTPHQVRSIYLVWNEKLKLARLPLKYFANGHSFFVQVLP